MCICWIILNYTKMYVFNLERSNPEVVSQILINAQIYISLWYCCCNHDLLFAMFFHTLLLCKAIIDKYSSKFPAIFQVYSFKEMWLWHKFYALLPNMEDCLNITFCRSIFLYLGWSPSRSSLSRFRQNFTEVIRASLRLPVRNILHINLFRTLVLSVRYILHNLIWTLVRDVSDITSKFRPDTYPVQGFFCPQTGPNWKLTRMVSPHQHILFVHFLVNLNFKISWQSCPFSQFYKPCYWHG